MRTHTKARSAHPQYPPRSQVPDNMVAWDTLFVDYSPVEFTAPVVLKNDSSKVPNGWADPEIVHPEELLARVSYSGRMQLDPHSNRPLNPVGRTGMTGRGLLGKWGPNHAADPIVTRYNPQTGHLELVVIQRRDTGEWAIPGGMVDPGELVSATLKREFGEEAMGNLDFDQQTEIKQQLDDLFSSQGKEIYRGYVDDPRNTDNSWMETVAMHFHCSPSLGAKLQLQAADDAVNVQWIRIDYANGELPNLYASHQDFVRTTIEKMPPRKRSLVTPVPAQSTHTAITPPQTTDHLSAHPTNLPPSANNSPSQPLLAPRRSTQATQLLFPTLVVLAVVVVGLYFLVTAI